MDDFSPLGAEQPRGCGPAPPPQWETAGARPWNLYKRAIRALKSAAFVSRPTWTTSRFGRFGNDEAGFGRPQI